MRLPGLAALVLAAPVLAASALPHLRAGLWEQTQTMTGLPTPARTTTSRFCTDDAVQARFNAFAQNGMTRMAQCSAPRIGTGEGGIVLDVECSQSGMANPMHTVVRGDFTTGYTSDLTMAFTGAPAGMAMPAMAIHVVSRFAGACPTGMRPGDVTMNGRTVNVLDSAAPRP